VTTSALGRGVLCALAISGTSALASPVSADMQPIVWFASGTTSGAGVPLSDAALPASRIARLKAPGTSHGMKSPRCWAFLAAPFTPGLPVPRSGSETSNASL
jgi:hypothetical protein